MAFLFIMTDDGMVDDAHAAHNDWRLARLDMASGMEPEKSLSFKALGGASNHTREQKSRNRRSVLCSALHGILSRNTDSLAAETEGKWNENGTPCLDTPESCLELSILR